MFGTHYMKISFKSQNTWKLLKTYPTLAILAGLHYQFYLILIDLQLIQFDCLSKFLPAHIPIAILIHDLKDLKDPSLILGGVNIFAEYMYKFLKLDASISILIKLTHNSIKISLPQLDIQLFKYYLDLLHSRKCTYLFMVPLPSLSKRSNARLKVWNYY